MKLKIIFLVYRILKAVVKNKLIQAKPSLSPEIHRKIKAPIIFIGQQC